MSTSAISFGSGPAQVQGQSSGQQIMQDFKQLASSLQSGDLSGAQQAYSALQQLLPSQSQNSNPTSNDFKALGQALQSGDLSSAQSAFSQLQSDLSSSASNLTAAIRGHHHRHHADSTQAGSSSGSNGQTVNLLA